MPLGPGIHMPFYDLYNTFHYHGYSENTHIVITVPVLFIWGEEIDFDSVYVTAKLTILSSFSSLMEQRLYLHLSTLIVSLQDTELGG